MNPYKDIVLNNTAKILSLLDRDEDSPTYGCFDRDHWHYKIRDFASAILQQGCLVLAQVFSNKFDGNIYYNNEKIKKWSIAAINYWVKIQHRDGSFDEYWPNEHGYPPTVFSTYAVSETYRILDLDDTRIKKALLKSARFLLKKKESGAVNQEIASVAALYSVYLTTKKKELLPKIKIKLKNMLKLQSKEGWFPEYGGADIGYLSVSLHFLAEYYRLSKDRRILTNIRKLVEFIQYFIHPDGSSGGDYGSRNTQYFMRGGLEIVAKEIPLAGAIADKLLTNHPDTTDQRYIEHYCLHSYVSALIHHQKRKKNLRLPCETACDKYFHESGLVVKRQDDWYCIVNLNKGGTVKLYKGNKNIVNDCGYRVWKNGLGVTNWVAPEAKKKVENGSLSVRMNLYKAKFFTPTAIKHSVLRVLSFVFGSRMIPLLKKIMINPSKKMDVEFKRRIVFNKNEIELFDEISSEKMISKIKSNYGFSLRYVPSSKYFQKSELYEKSPSINLKNSDKAKIRKIINLDKGQISVKSL